MGNVKSDIKKLLVTVKSINMILSMDTWWLNLRIVKYPEKKYSIIPCCYFVSPYNILLKYTEMIFLCVFLEISASRRQSRLLRSLIY